MNDHVKNQLCARIEELEAEKMELNEQLDALKEERDALAAHVKLISEDRSDLLERLRQFPGWTPTPLRADEWDQLTSDLITSVEETPDAPETSLARLKAEWQTEALERLRELLQTTHMDQAPTVSRAAMHVNDAINRVAQECGVVTIRSQAEEGEA